MVIVAKAIEIKHTHEPPEVRILTMRRHHLQLVRVRGLYDLLLGL